MFSSPAFDRFREIEDGEDIENQDNIQFKGDGRTTRDVKNLDDTTFDCVNLKYNNPEPEIDIVSNSHFHQILLHYIHGKYLDGMKIEKKIFGDKQKKPSINYNQDQMVQMRVEILE